MIENNEDIWDDRLLIKAYEEAVQLQSADIAKRIANETNKRPVTCDASQTTKDSESEEVDDVTIVDYKIGDFVRATYNVDGIDYEAEIISVDEEEEICVVKYIGYDNEQTVRLGDLTTSWGEDEREKQMAEAAEAVESNAESDENLHEDADMHYHPHSLLHAAPPMPPMPPMLANSLNEENEHLSAMLMAWYMSGYYTGLYQGHKMAQQQAGATKKREHNKGTSKRK